MATIGFVGGGNMAEALIKGIIIAKLYRPEDIWVSDISGERLELLTKQYNVRTTAENNELAAKVEIIVLSVKPQNMTEMLRSIKGAVRQDALVISIAAGKRIAGICAVLGDVPIVRVMPNTPALIGEGTSALFANDKAKPMLEKAKTLFSSVGEIVVLDNEELMDAVTAVSGSGPAYYFLLTEEMIKAGVELGLSEEVTKKLVLQTAKGAALLAQDAERKGESAGELRQKVTSPGGTTAAALKVFTDAKFGPMVKAAVKKACEKSQELSK